MKLKTRKKHLLFFLFFVLSGSVLFADPSGLLATPDGKVSFSSSLELGFFGFFAHNIQFDRDGTYFDYVADGGQDVLFPFQRISADITFNNRHTVTFLVQPIDVRTSILLGEDLVVDDETFSAGTAMNLRYGFDYYRLSYLYDFFEDPARELGIGLSMQFRDAVIDFASADGIQFIGNRNVGPVPILKFRFRTPLGEYFWIGSEIDGFYAAITVLNGSLESQVTGIILDASLRAGIAPSDFFEAFLNLRYLGGGAEGDAADSTPPGDGYSKNYLHAFSVSLGGRLK